MKMIALFFLQVNRFSLHYREQFLSLYFRIKSFSSLGPAYLGSTVKREVSAGEVAGVKGTRDGVLSFD